VRRGVKVTAEFLKNPPYYVTCVELAPPDLEARIAVTSAIFSFRRRFISQIV
jgi:hypothetical protein